MIQDVKSLKSSIFFFNFSKILIIFFSSLLLSFSHVLFLFLCFFLSSLIPFFLPRLCFRWTVVFIFPESEKEWEKQREAGSSQHCSSTYEVSPPAGATMWLGLGGAGTWALSHGTVCVLPDELSPTPLKVSHWDVRRDPSLRPQFPTCRKSLHKR